MGYFSEVFASSYGTKRPKFFFWYPPGTTKSDKKLMHKIDFFILTYACMNFFVKWLDQANLSNAYVSGMKEDLHMYGNEFNLANTVYNVGSILGSLISNLIVTRVSPRYWLPGCEIAWGLITMGTYKISSYNHLYPLRFFLGLFEGSSFVGIQYVLGSWYTKKEIGKRTAIFTCSSYVGTAFGGYIQSAVQATLAGRHGLEAWRWVFIIDGVITVGTALYGVIFFPGTPDTTTAFYFSAEEKARCRERMKDEGVVMQHKLTLNILKRIVTSWQFYVLAILFGFWETTVGKVGNTVFQLWLKNVPSPSGEPWSIYNINNIPTSLNGFNIVMLLAATCFIDATGWRMGYIMFHLAMQLFGTAVLLAWDVPFGLHIVGYLFAACDGPLSAVYLSWANILTAHDSQVRAITLAMMNAFGTAVTLLIQQFLYEVTSAPKFRKGFAASLGFLIGMLGWVFVVRFCELWTVKHASDKAVVIQGLEGGASTADEMEEKGATIDTSPVSPVKQ
ncbi:hypothetical protein A1O1_02690 [Capronia coronata CBS 617.96]|uniref:Major facilitator superfamily (MFS) profile domain-containing protein n=1 Tax=Capronia coronata CBS 617.96 TaxID=1182541 RepID=W9YYD3_9EURO|nr:uncharacterized protein A1O1_02690 [Capronia coronata CBS 617.96]EXJ94296.1 hypothetical protein A1O1_02690 [Capronia coronata CBS 617.96]